MQPMVSDTRYLTGKLLIASPLIGDPRFDRALVYLCSHDQDQAMGLIINSPMEGLGLQDVLDQLDVPGAPENTPERPVLNGGPVGQDRGFVLHSRDINCGPTSVIINHDYALTATREILECISSDCRPEAFIFALGYAGWDSGQLEDEISANAWLVCEPDEALLFDEDYEDKWTRALSILGVTPEFLTASSGHA